MITLAVSEKMDAFAADTIWSRFRSCANPRDETTALWTENVAATTRKDVDDAQRYYSAATCLRRKQYGGYTDDAR